MSNNSTAGIESTLEDLEFQCDECTTKKKCTLRYAAVIKRYPDVLKDISKYLDKQGYCKGFNGKNK